jgi:SAM-dependent methyltransferase
MSSSRACRLCSSDKIEIAWNLCPAPYGDLFKKDKLSAVGLTKHSLTLMLCRNCKHLQLAEEVDADEIYCEYVYQSSVTSGLRTYYQRLAQEMVNLIGLTPSSLVVDVGSNDGTGLLPYKGYGIRVFGVEPSNDPAQVAVDSGIPTLNEFLNDESVEKVISEVGLARLVCANYVAANVPRPVDFFRSIRSLLSSDGWVSILTGYHPDQFAIGMFEYINHDHLSYFTVSSALNLAKESGLILVSAQRVEHKGGSIHLVFRTKESNAHPNESVAQLLQREEWLRVKELETYTTFADAVKIKGNEIRHELTKLNSQNIAGVGASISTTHLMYQFGLNEFISTLFDDDKNKIGRYSPGLGLPVLGLENLSEMNFKIVVILAWQHSRVLLKRLREVDEKLKVFIPMPFCMYKDKQSLHTFGLHRDGV